jgi:hypothetical protein
MVAARLTTPSQAFQTHPAPAPPQPSPRPAEPAPDTSRNRALEKRFLALRSRFVASMVANALLAATLVAAIIVLGDWDQPPALDRSADRISETTDPVFTGPGLSPTPETDPLTPPQNAEATDPDPDSDPASNANTDESPVQDPPDPVEPPPPARAFDITLLSWQDAHTHLLTVTDESSLDSITAGLRLLEQYHEAVGLPDEGIELRDAWLARIEQLRLGGSP